MQELIREVISHDLLERYINEWLSIVNTTHNWKRLHQILINMNNSIGVAMGTDTSIYANNGTLTAARTLNGGGNNLTFTGLNKFFLTTADSVFFTSGLDVTTVADGTIILEAPVIRLLPNSATGDPADVWTNDGNGNGSWAPSSGGGPGVNIYNGNGVLTSNRTLDGDTYELLFTNLAKFTLDNTTEVVVDSPTTSFNSTDFTLTATNPYLVTSSTAASLEGSPLLALAPGTGKFGFAAYAFPPTLSIADDGKVLQYDHGTTSFVMASAGVDTNIYTTNGTLTGARVLTGATNPLTFTGLSTFTLSAGALSITALTGATTFTSASTFTINSSLDLTLNVTGDITVTQALNHDTAPDSIVALTGTGTGTLSYITPAELLTATGAVTNNIYAGNGTLASNRTVSGGGLYSIAFNNTTASTFTSNGLTTIGSIVEIDLLSPIVDIQTGALGARFTSSAVQLRLGNHFSSPAGTLVQATVTNTGEVNFTPFKFPTSLGAGDTGKTLMYDHGTGTFTMGTGSNFATADLSFTGNRTHDLDGFDLIIQDTVSDSAVSFIMNSGDFLVTGNGMNMGLNNSNGEMAYMLSHNVSNKKEVVRAGQIGGLPGGLTRGVELGSFSDVTSPNLPDGGTAYYAMRFHEQGIEIYSAISGDSMKLNIAKVPNYADNAAALFAGLVVGDVYRTAGALKIVV